MQIPWFRGLGGDGRSRRRRTSLLATATLIGGLIPAGLVLGSTPAAAAGGTGVSFTLSGCRNPSAGVYNPDGGTYYCADSEYTTGNLGKSWNELDSVPFKLVSTAGNSAPASQTFTVAVAVDEEDAGHPGYFEISDIQRKQGSCAASFGATHEMSPGLGGIDKTLWRPVTITQAKGTTCTIDYYATLDIGSHLFPGSSLHGNVALPTSGDDVTTSGIGARDVSIPVKEISPQEIQKSTSASQGVTTSWHIDKTPAADNFNFENTCNVADGLQQTTTKNVTVTWTKLTPSANGDLIVHIIIKAKNPSLRTVKLHYVDTIYFGQTASGTSVAGPTGDANVAPSGDNYVQIYADDTTIAAADVPSNTDYVSNYVKGTYKDYATDKAFPGFTEYTDENHQIVRNATDGSVDVSDSEYLLAGAVDTSSSSFDPTGLSAPTGMQFSVTKVSGPGAFSGGYVAGTKVSGIGPVVWSVSGQTDTGSVEFQTTLYVDKAATPSATLYDKATMTGSSSGVLASAKAHVDVTSGTSAKIEVDKSISQTVGSTQTFKFDIKSGSTVLETLTVTISAGQTTGNATSTNWYAPGAYTVHEQTPTGASAGWALPTDGTVNVASGTCSYQQPMANQLDPARAKVQKFTDPTGAGQEAGWVFTLAGGALPSGGVSVTTTDTDSTTPGSDEMTFQTPANTGTLFLDAGTYTVTEAAQPHWTNTKVEKSVTGGESPSLKATVNTCTFTVAYPRDHDAVFECYFTNVQQARLRLHKTNSSLSGPAMPNIPFELRSGASTTAVGTKLQTASTDSSGNIDFGWLDAGTTVSAMTYQLCETGVKTAWDVTFSDGGTFTPFIAVDSTADNSTVCSNVTLKPGDDETINVVDTPPPGGDARTIGYWKNWSGSYSGGKQENVLGDVLTKSGGLVMALDSSNAPSFTVTAATEQTAIYILNKQDAGGQHKKLASDPAYNMAAQLLAAELDYAAGAYTCSNVTSAMTEAQQLLGKYSYNASGTYASKLSKTDAARMNDLASLFDHYNNNTLPVCT